MSVLLKGMEMPKSCDECELCTCYVREDGTEENYRCVITFYPIHEFNERHEYCPLVEVDDNEIDEALKALKGVRDAYRIITEAFCRPPETDIGSKPK